ncbi:MAG: alpha/beta fold hydrolase [Gammaproteobacteria bacterium]|nr:alpha/beta fold hydrolase [Gammaproteobacteria bacterium]NNM00642.1 alpha/beta fold hydrolase [Gammaproteobacteria bacterium]
MLQRLDFDRDGADWPHREYSRFVSAGGLRWHVQQMGAGPALLLVHGTGASTHSWGGLMPLLAEHFTVLAPDLPGHAFTDTPPAPRMSMAGMAADLALLLEALAFKPRLAIGHSAGAAIVATMSLAGSLALDGAISLNGSMVPLRGVAGHVFSPLARLLAGTSWVPRWFARRAAQPAVIRRLIGETGSVLDTNGLEYYRLLAGNSAHAAAVLNMMANWDLDGLVRDLPRLSPPLLQIVGGADRTVPPADAERVRELLPGAKTEILPGLGHLAHEEAPDTVAPLVLAFARGTGVLPAA